MLKIPTDALPVVIPVIFILTRVVVSKVLMVLRVTVPTSRVIESTPESRALDRVKEDYVNDLIELKHYEYYVGRILKHDIPYTYQDVERFTYVSNPGKLFKEDLIKMDRELK